MICFVYPKTIKIASSLLWTVDERRKVIESRLNIMEHENCEEEEADI